ncbi:MAG: carbohydrate binding family 9 domain-containing protein [Gemmatimonadetes bacterium]|nr:carbohydrate binding family 9 domain-containing protein [Gemmatimonadota bacterium]
MLLPFLFALQATVARGPAPPPDALPSASASRSVPAPTANSATAALATTAPVLDGKDDDALWRDAPAITQFRQHDPVEDGDPRYRTEARVGYDARYLYVFVRAFDPAPDSVMAFLSRRDARTQSDYIHLMVDAYHDRRTAFRFSVNPLGVKRDFYLSGDGDEDASWDGVWEVATAVDSLGWTAEYRIPFGQLRFPEAPSHTFGFAIWREIARYNERISWPLYRRSRTGLVSQFGDVSGFDGITAPRRLEVLPYSVATNAPRPVGNAFERQQDFAFGADVKYGLTSNLTLDGTVNPDFGQVEADPAVLNLTAFEQFFQERRPFFLEGAGIFSFDAQGGDGDVSNALFYSRRVGRGPQLSGRYYDQDNPSNSTILGAAKLTGRTAGGLNVGFLDAVTQREQGALGRTIEPQSNYLVTRLQQDFKGGNSGVGMMLTATNRSLDDDSRAYLRESAYAFGIDARHRFRGNNYEVRGSAVASRVAGSASSILATQRSAVHFYQRPDSRLTVDSNATSLDGSRVNLSLGKTGGGVVRFQTGVSETSAGYEINDAGFLPRADERSQYTWVGLQFQKPTKYYRRANININQWNGWNTEGLHLNSGGNININGELPNQWFVYTGFNLNGIGTGFDDRASRGGPALRRNQRRNTWFGVQSDRRKPTSFTMQGFVVFKDVSGSKEWGIDPSVNFRVASRVQAEVGMHLSAETNDAQWYDNVTDGSGTHYTFAHLDQRTSAITTRLDFTLTPTLSFQLYAQPFITAGDYSDHRELADPRAARYADRFRPYTGAPLEDFNFKQFRSNSVVRWEYRPGSVLFFVWQQGRGQGDRNAGDFNLGRDYGDLFKSRSDNTFLIKGSYWFSL